MQEKDTLLLLNKIDLLESRSTLDSLLARYPGAIAISARTGEGFDQLADVVSSALSRFFQDVIVETGVENGKLLAYLNASAEVLSTKFCENRAIVHCRISAEALGRINDPTATYQRYEGPFGTAGEHSPNADGGHGQPINGFAAPQGFLPNASESK
jgi:GTP-binding protein HflX